MLHTIAQLMESHVVDGDGVSGRVLDAYFDERTWQIRYLLLEVAAASGDRTLVFAADAVREMDQERGTILIDRFPPFDLAAVACLRSLRSSRAVLDCAVAGWTGAIGRTEDALFEPESWVLRFLMIDTSDWCPSGVIFIAPDLIQAAEWDRQALQVAVTHIEVLEMPEDDLDAAHGLYKSRILH